MSLEDKILIGMEISVNSKYTFNLQEYAMSYSDLREVGPRPSVWKFDGVAVVVQIAAPVMVSI